MEKDVRAAARAGQALLVRHEAYVADSERERSRLSFNLSNLEDRNKTLEGRNDVLIKENRALGEEMKDLNEAVADADTKIQSLTSQLQTTQQELHRLSNLASRAEQLETQLLQLEVDQARLQVTLTRTAAEEREVRQKWLGCQRSAIDLQEQMESIERAAQEDRQRHVELLARMEQSKAVETKAQMTIMQNELAAKMVSDQSQGNSAVVSSFVKNILRDNASMQLNMVEMQDMLAQAEEELQALKEQIPAAAIQPSRQNGENPKNLGEELEGPLNHRDSRELHVHHHYHALNKQRSAVRKPHVLQPRRKKSSIASGSGASTPTTVSSISTSLRRNLMFSRSFSGSDVTQPAKRWSALSAQTKSSVTSYATSPPSTIFESTFDGDGTDYSRPTSPESSGAWSPVLSPADKYRSVDETLFQHLSQPMEFISERVPSPQKYTREEPQTPTAPTRRQTPDHSPVRNPFNASPRRQPTLRRIASHASLISISGMDIHTSLPEIKVAPRGATRLLRSQPSLATVALSYAADNSNAVVTTTTASTIRRPLLAGASSSSTSWSKLRGNLAATDSAASMDERYNPVRDTLGKFGGWLPTRWIGGGQAPGSSSMQAGEEQTTKAAEPSKRTVSDSAATIVQTRPIETLSAPPDIERTPTAPIAIPPAPRIEGDMSPSPKKSSTPRFRPSGINQYGGLPPIPRRLRNVVASPLDEEALKECLGGD